MKNNKLKILIIIFFMTFVNFKNVSANYEKIFFDFNLKSIKGEQIKLSDFKGKSILMVNVASYCGFTNQYNDLQELWDTYKSQGLVVIGIPSNQFGAQEPGTNKEIKDFCEVNFNITFPMTSKMEVKGDNAHEIYKWALKNYGKSTIPKWNFHKILINKQGKIEDTFMSFTKPLSKKVTSKIEELLN